MYPSRESYKMMMDQAHLGEYLFRQQMLHAATLGGLHHRINTEPPACEARLLNGDLWRRFHDIGTEMIITKGGRRMFPSLRVSLSGLDPREEYCVLLELSLVGRRRWRWAGGTWTAAGGAEPQSSRRYMMHPDSPSPGHHWVANPVSFSKLKLTNNTMDAQGHIILTSMHKYCPRVFVVRSRDAATFSWGAPHASFSFPETEFIAVTAYQNDRITKLKIDNNPFAKGFRACGQSKCKRKNSETTNTDSNTESERTESVERKRPCSEATSSCSEEGSVRSSSSTSPPLSESPTPLVAATDDITPSSSACYAPEIPYFGPIQMSIPFWANNSINGGVWSPITSVLPPPIAPAAPAPCRRVKDFTIKSILGES